MVVSCNGGLNQMRAAVSGWLTPCTFCYPVLVLFDFLIIWCMLLNVQICDMVAIARYLNVTLIVPELDKTSFWADPRWASHSFYALSIVVWVESFVAAPCVWTMISHLIDCLLLLCCSDFQDIFDVDHFITSLRDEVRILKELPPRLKLKVERGFLYSMPPISWSDISYYKNQVSLW